jgi:transposase
MGARQIAKWLDCDRKTIRKVLRSREEIPKPRKNKFDIEDEVLSEVFIRCSGQRERVHEILTTEYGKEIGYSTLTRLIREKKIGIENKERSCQVPDIPGEEFQHDTSPYCIDVGGKKIKVQASVVYYRYSKVRYLYFYRSFTRFHMKNFFHEALSYWGYVPKICVIDNTNLAVLKGTGENAVFVPEMIMFAKQYGFDWKAHRVKHSDRKGGVESGFWFIERNFFPGRTFNSMDDLNAQALEWVKSKSKLPTTKKNIIPIDAFKYEIPHMTIVHKGLLPPYRQHGRTVDQYGYVAFNANFFWVPYEIKSNEILVLEFAKTIHLYDGRKKVMEYVLPNEEVRNERFSPEGVSVQKQPRLIKRCSGDHESKLREKFPEIIPYLDEGLRINGSHKLRYTFIEGLYHLGKKLSSEIFLETVRRANRFRVYNIKTLDGICAILMRQESYDLPDEEILFDYKQRPEYLEGAESELPSPSFYKKRSGVKHNENA